MDSSAIIPSQPGSSVTLARYLKLFAAAPTTASHENLQVSLRKFKAYIEAPSGKREAFLTQISERKTVQLLYSLWNRVHDDKNLQLTILQTLIALVRADKETTHSTANDIYSLFVPQLIDILECCIDPSDKSYNSITYFGLCAELLDSHCSGKSGKTTCETLLRNVPLRKRVFALIQMSAAFPSAQAQLYILLLSNRLYRYASQIRTGVFTTVLEEIASFKGITKDDITKISAKVEGSSANVDFRKVAREVRFEASERVRSGLIKLDRDTVPETSTVWAEALEDLTTAGVFSFTADSVVITYKDEAQNVVTEPRSHCEFLDVSILGFASSVFVTNEKDSKGPKGSLTSDANQRLGSVTVLQHSWLQVDRILCDVNSQTISFHTLSNQEASAMTHGRLYSVSGTTDLNLDLTAIYHFPSKEELAQAVDRLHLLIPTQVSLEVTSKSSTKSKNKANKLTKVSEASDSYQTAELASRAAGGLPSTITPLSPSPSDKARSMLGIQKAIVIQATNSEVAHLQNFRAGKSVKISKSGEIKSVSIKSADATAIFEVMETVDKNHDKVDEEEEEEEENVDVEKKADAVIKDVDVDANKAANDAETDDNDDNDEDNDDIHVITKLKPEEEEEDLSAWQQTTHENEPRTSLTQALVEPEYEAVPLAADANETRVNKSKKKTEVKNDTAIDVIVEDRPLHTRKARAGKKDYVSAYADDSSTAPPVVETDIVPSKRSRSGKQAKGRNNADDDIEQAAKGNDSIVAKGPKELKGRTGKLNLVVGATKPSGTIAGIVSMGSGPPKQQQGALSNVAATKNTFVPHEVLPPPPSHSKTSHHLSDVARKANNFPAANELDFNEEDQNEKEKGKTKKMMTTKMVPDDDDEENDANPSHAKKSKRREAYIVVESSFVPLTSSSSSKFVTPALQLSTLKPPSKVPIVKEKDKKSKLYDDGPKTTEFDYDESDSDKAAVLPSKTTGKTVASKPAPKEPLAGKKGTKEVVSVKTKKLALSKSAEKLALSKSAPPLKGKVVQTETDDTINEIGKKEEEEEEEEEEEKDKEKNKEKEKKRKKKEDRVLSDDEEASDDDVIYPHDDKPRKRAKTGPFHQEELKKKEVAKVSPVQPSVSVMPTKLAAAESVKPVAAVSKSSHSTAPPLTSSMKKKNKLKMDEEAATREKPIISYSGVGVMEEESQVLNPIPFGLEDDDHHAQYSDVGLNDTVGSAAVSASSAEPERQLSELLASENEDHVDDDDDDDGERHLRNVLKEQCEEILVALTKTLEHHEKRLLATLEREQLTDLSIQRGAEMTLEDLRESIPSYVDLIKSEIARAEGIFKEGTARYDATVTECEAFIKKQASQLRKVEASCKEQSAAIDKHRAEMTAFADGLVKSTTKAAERAVAEFKAKESGLKADYKKFMEKINKKKRLSEETIKGFL